MMEMEEAGGGLVVRGRVEIDMRRPFKSVKEAVMLFGDKILAEELYTSHKLKQATTTKAMIEGEKKHEYRTKVEAIVAELEETKQSLEKAKEDDTCMAYYLTSLKQELEETKSELKQLKSKRDEIKFINENPITINHPLNEDTKRSVKFASPPSLTKVMQPSSVNKKLALRKTIIPSLAGIFSRKKRS